jgi:hypothetical protein
MNKFYSTQEEYDEPKSFLGSKVGKYVPILGDKKASAVNKEEQNTAKT